MDWTHMHSVTQYFLSVFPAILPILQWECSDGGQDVDDQLQKELESAAEQIVAEFQQGMQEVMDNLEKAQMAFDDLSGWVLCMLFCVGGWLGGWVGGWVGGCLAVGWVSWCVGGQRCRIWA
jgi:hypothetical protein